MFHFLPYDKQVCLLSHSFELKLDTCKQPLDFLDFPNSYFFIFRRILIAICLLELVRSICHFMCCFIDRPTKLATLWHHDRFLALPLHVTQQVHSTNNFINMVVWILLTYAAISFAPHLMWPWLIYYYAFLACRLFKFSLRAATNNLPRSHISLTLSGISMLLKVGFVTFCKGTYDTVLRNL